MEKKYYQVYDDVRGPDNVRVTPYIHSSKMEDVKNRFDSNTILGLELPINKKENSKKDKGARLYYAFASNLSHQMWQGCNNDKCYFNEYALGEDEVRLVFDYDIKKSETTLFKWDKDVEVDSLDAIKVVMDELVVLFDPDDNNVDYTIFTSCREDKISYHIIFVNVSIKFKLIPNIIKNIITKMKFNETTREYIFKHPSDKNYKDNPTWFDLNIYPTFDNSAKSVRLVEHAKRSNDIKLFPVRGSKITNPGMFYIKHREELDIQIKELYGNLVIDKRIICEIDKKYVKTREIKCPSKCAMNKNKLLEVFKHLNEGRRAYEYRIRVMFALFNAYGEDGKDLYIEFAKGGNKDRSGKAFLEWSGIKDSRSKHGCTLGTVMFYLQEDDVEYYNNMRKNSNPRKLFHDIGFMDITYDTFYKDLASKVYVIDETEKDEKGHRNDLKLEMKDIFYKIKACIAMFKTPQNYYRLKRVKKVSTGLEVVYENTNKLDKNFYINTSVCQLEGKEKTRVFVKKRIMIEDLIGQGTKLGIMYNFITFYPSTEPTEDLNTFTGFVGSIKYDTKNTNYQPILDHIKNVICGNNDGYYEYYMNVITHSFQKPHIRTEVVPLLVGDQGCGKSILYEKFLIPFVLGVKYSKTVDSIEVVLEKHFNLSETLLLVFEEAMFAGHRKEYNALKHKVSGRQVIVNEKFKDIREVESYLNISMISNHDHPMPLDDGDRRYFPLRCDDTRKGSIEYFNEMSKCFNKETGHAFYNYLMSRELVRITEPPITPLKRSIINASKDKISDFIDRVNEGDIECNHIITIHSIEYFAFEYTKLSQLIGDGHLNMQSMKKKLLDNGWQHKSVVWKEFGVKKQGNRFIVPKPKIEYIETDDMKDD